MLHNNINESIRAALLPLLTTGLTIPGDRLNLNVIKSFPLQDDPTIAAPYVVYGPDPTLGILPRPDIAMIGGPTMHFTHWRMVFGSPLATTRDQAYADIGELADRLTLILEANYQLGGLQSTGGAEQLSGNSPSDLIYQTKTRIYGGDTTFYGEGMILFRYCFERVRNW